MNILDYGFVIPALIFLIVFTAYPVVYNIMLSVKDVTISNLVSGDAPIVGFKNFSKVLSDARFLKATLNTLIFMISCLSFQFIFGMLLALFFNQKFAGARWMRSIILTGWMNPIIITASIFTWLLSGDSGVVNYILSKLHLISEPILFLTNPVYGLISLIVANIWIGIPFNMILLLAGMQGLPHEVYEAACIDGANKVTQFFKITLPMLKPTISILLMMGVIYTFKVFDLIFIMTKGGPARSTQTLPYYSYELSFQTFKFGEGAAVSVIIFIIVLTISLFYLKASKKEGDLG